MRSLVSEVLCFAGSEASTRGSRRAGKSSRLKQCSENVFKLVRGKSEAEAGSDNVGACFCCKWEARGTHGVRLVREGKSAQKAYRRS